MPLDVFTLAVMVTVVSLTMAGSLLWVSRHSDRRGLKLCAGALVLFGLSMPVMALRGIVLLEPLSIVIGNMMISATLAMLLLAVCRFHNIKPNPWWILPPMIVLAPGLLLMLHSLSGRIIFASLLFAGQHIVLSWVTHKNKPMHNDDGHLMAAAAPFACALVLVVRALLEALGINNMPSFTTSELRYNYFIVTMVVAVIVFTLGFIFMVRQAVDEDYRQLSIRDDLTGIANRRHLINQLRVRLAEAGRTATPLTLLLIDLDHFKEINDRLGHLVGDLVLKEVVRTITSRVRINDLVGRYGGEEFIVLLPHTAPQTALKLAEDLRRAVESTTIRHGDLQLKVSVSIGVCGSLPESPLSQEALLEGADRAMYLAKGLGRNRVALVDGKNRQATPAVLRPGRNEA